MDYWKLIKINNGLLDNKWVMVIIDRVALAKQGDNALGSVRPSVCVFVRLCALEHGEPLPVH